jgi:hypothetical protein
MLSVPASQTVPGAQTGQSVDEPVGEEDEEIEDDEKGQDYEEEAGGDSQMGGFAETQQTTSSSVKPKYIISVSKKAHITRKDEYTFKDAKGKTRITEKKD